MVPYFFAIVKHSIYLFLLFIFFVGLMSTGESFQILIKLARLWIPTHHFDIQFFLSLSEFSYARLFLSKISIMRKQHVDSCKFQIILVTDCYVSFVVLGCRIRNFENWIQLQFTLFVLVICCIIRKIGRASCRERVWYWV